MAKQIPAFRRYLDVEDRVFREQCRDRLADLCFRRKNQEPVTVLRQSQLARATEHSLRLHAAELARFDLEIAHEYRARQRERNFVADLVILRAANDLALLAAAI